jgi:general secretion pathway protein G
MRLNKTLQTGFTLIELLVVMTIVAILLTLVAPRYLGHLDRSREAVLKENLSVMRQSIDQYKADTNQYPPSLSALVEKRYLRVIPQDPITERADTWIITPPPEGEGVYNIQSGAEGQSRDGSYYADW